MKKIRFVCSLFFAFLSFSVFADAGGRLHCESTEDEQVKVDADLDDTGITGEDGLDDSTSQVKVSINGKVTMLSSLHRQAQQIVVHTPDDNFNGGPITFEGVFKSEGDSLKVEIRGQYSMAQYKKKVPITGRATVTFKSEEAVVNVTCTPYK